MTSPNQSVDALFEQELEVFRTEAETGTQFFYAWLGVHATMSDHRPVLDLLNEASPFWATNLGALQQSAHRHWDASSIRTKGPNTTSTGACVSPKTIDKSSRRKRSVGERRANQPVRQSGCPVTCRRRTSQRLTTFEGEGTYAEVEAGV